MFTSELWSVAQRGLLSDPSYLGMKLGRSLGSVAVVWLDDAGRTTEAKRAIERLAEAGITVEQEVRVPSQSDVGAEEDRLAEVTTVDLYIIGSNPEETRVEVTIAKGSFAEARDRGTAVLVELNPQVPLVIEEGGQPITA